MKQLIYDYLLVKEVIPEDTIGDTGLKTKYDDSERFMYVEVVQASEMLADSILKEYPNMSETYVQEVLVDGCFRPGNILIINRVAKTPYKDGLYFISIKDVIGVEKLANE